MAGKRAVGGMSVFENITEPLFGRGPDFRGLPRPYSLDYPEGAEGNAQWRADVHAWEEQNPIKAKPEAAPEVPAATPETKAEDTRIIGPTGEVEKDVVPSQEEVNQMIREAEAKPAEGIEAALPGAAQAAADPYTAYLKELKTERERRQSQRDRSKWEALAAMGFGMMGSESPYALQALGEGGAKGLEYLQKGRKSQREAEDALYKEQGLAIRGKMNADAYKAQAMELKRVAERTKIDEQYRKKIADLDDSIMMSPGTPEYKAEIDKINDWYVGRIIALEGPNAPGLPASSPGLDSEAINMYPTRTAQ